MRIKLKDYQRLKTGRVSLLTGPFSYIPFPVYAILGPFLILLVIAGIVLLGLIPVFQSSSNSRDSSFISDTELNVTERGFTNISVSTDLMGSFATRSRNLVVCDTRSILYDFDSFTKLAEKYLDGFKKFSLLLYPFHSFICDNTFISYQFKLNIISDNFLINKKTMSKILLLYQNYATKIELPPGIFKYAPVSELVISYSGTVGFQNGTIIDFQACKANMTSDTFKDQSECNDFRQTGRKKTTNLFNLDEMSSEITTQNIVNSTTTSHDMTSTKTKNTTSDIPKTSTTTTFSSRSTTTRSLTLSESTTALYTRSSPISSDSSTPFSLKSTESIKSTTLTSSTIPKTTTTSTTFPITLISLKTFIPVTRTYNHDDDWHDRDDPNRPPPD